MTLFPDVQKRAQDEIDAKIGRDRLPTFEDKDELPYVADVAVEMPDVSPYFIHMKLRS